MIVRWGLGELGPVLAEAGIADPLLVTSERFAALPLPAQQRFTGVRAHTPTATVREATRAAARADGLVPVGGGSAIDTAKAVSARTGLPVVSVPTTYSGSEWTTFFGHRDEEQRLKGGGGGARPVGIVYDPRLTLDLPADVTGGTALNALAHAAEALYTTTRRPEGDEDALAGARLIATWLPRTLAHGDDLEARTELLRGAMYAGAALAASFMGLAHAIAQALGGRYGLPHGAMNALVLGPTLRYNAAEVPDAILRLAEALDAEDAPAEVERLAHLAGFTRLRDFQVPQDELEEVARAAVDRPAARANPRRATVEDVATLLEELW